VPRGYYIGSAEGHEYPNLQVGDEVNPRTLFVLTKADKQEFESGVSHGKLNYHVGRSCFPSVTYEPPAWAHGRFNCTDQGNLGKEGSMISDLQLTGRACGPKHTPSL